MTSQRGLPFVDDVEGHNAEGAEPITAATEPTGPTEERRDANLERV